MSRSRYGRRALVPYSEALSAAQRSEKAPQPLCADRPREFVDYEEVPTEAQAQALCAGCPLLEMCFNNARRTKPGWGVWAGVAWIYGRQVHLLDDEEKRSLFYDLKA